MAADGFDGHNVIAVSFEDDRSAYKALTVLEELDSQRRLAVREAVGTCHTSTVVVPAPTGKPPPGP